MEKQKLTKEQYRGLFIYSLESGNYLRRRDLGCTAAETIRKDFECPHDNDDSDTGCEECLAQCEDAIVEDDVSPTVIKHFEKDHGRLIVEGKGVEDA